MEPQRSPILRAALFGALALLLSAPAAHSTQPPESCRDIAAANPAAPDDLYTIFPGGKAFSVYCHDMAGEPREYLPLDKTGGSFNFSEFGSTHLQPGVTVTTHYTKIRLDPATLLVDTSDQTFSTSIGTDCCIGGTVIQSMPYAAASDCLAPNSAAGLANVDLTGTPFEVDHTFGISGFIARGSVNGQPGTDPSFDDDVFPTFPVTSQVVNLTGGGYCGGTFPLPINHLAFPPLNTTGGFILQLRYVGAIAFSPTCGPVGSSVILTGSGFSEASVVSFGGVEASFHVDSPTQISTTVPSGATTGPVAVTTPGGTAVSAIAFSVSGTPAISGFAPASGAAGSSVVITGTNLSCASSVSFGETPALFSVDSPSQITATVPAGVSSGPITVTTPGGSSTSSGDFAVATVANDLVRLDSTTVTQSAPPVPGGPAGTFTLRANFTNSSSTRIAAPFFEVTELTGGNLLLNADGGPGGTGAVLTPSVGSFLEPGESFTTDFVVGLQTRSRFTFFVDLMGTPTP